MRGASRPYGEAFNWRANIAAGTAYLAHLRDMLEKKGRFSYPALAACYRYGFNEVASHNFDISQLPPPKNKIYQQLFSGIRSPVPPTEE